MVNQTIFLNILIRYQKTNLQIRSLKKIPNKKSKANSIQKNKKSDFYKNKNLGI